MNISCYLSVSRFFFECYRRSEEKSANWQALMHVSCLLMFLRGCKAWSRKKQIFYVGQVWFTICNSYSVNFTKASHSSRVPPLALTVLLCNFTNYNIPQCFYIR